MLLGCTVTWLMPLDYMDKPSCTSSTQQFLFLEFAKLIKQFFFGSFFVLQEDTLWNIHEKEKVQELSNILSYSCYNDHHLLCPCGWLSCPGQKYLTALLIFYICFFREGSIEIDSFHIKVKQYCIYRFDVF